MKKILIWTLLIVIMINTLSITAISIPTPITDDGINRDSDIINPPEVTTNGEWVELLKPEMHESIVDKIICESTVSNPDEIFCVMYYFRYINADLFGYSWHADSNWAAYSPPYHYEWKIKSRIPAGDFIVVCAVSYIEEWTETGRTLTPVAESDYVTVWNNNKPQKPEAPSGRTFGTINTEYQFTTSTIDFDNDQLWYLFDWGDDTDSGWLGPYDSGETITARHKWTSNTIAGIKVKAKDWCGGESEWSDPLTVILSKSKDLDSTDNEDNTQTTDSENLISQSISFTDSIQLR